MIHEELHIKKVVCRCVPHDLTEPTKQECVRINKETHKLLNVGDHHTIFEIVTGDETCIPRFLTFENVNKAKSTGLVKAIKLEGQKTVTENWYAAKCLPEILEEVNVRGLMLHHHNACCHT
ncbi:uncharacterized protein TNCV_5118441 [Trichonephila clavipes]|nr:uncharacterized protein TNCV_5118441 [Trichonephila clavipes]